MFWHGLTLHEFWVKFAAFKRSEDRQRALVVELALMTTRYKKQDKSNLTQSMNALRRYPLKPWLQ